MKYLFLGYLLIFCSTAGFSQKAEIEKSSIWPDSVRVISLFGKIMAPVSEESRGRIGFGTENVQVGMIKEKKKRGFELKFPKGSEIKALGVSVSKSGKQGLFFPFEAAAGESYQLFLTMAGDSAGNFSIYSGYVFLPKSAKWKLIGTCRISGSWKTMTQPVTYGSSIEDAPPPEWSDIWYQQQNGRWFNIGMSKDKAPEINLNNHADSLVQTEMQKGEIQSAIKKKKLNTTREEKGLYYFMEKEGTGKQVLPTDTVTIFYKGYLLKDGTVFDQTTETPRVFPLNRLIQGWQIGLSLCKEGGKIKLVIPSHLAYGIRTRSPKIPPNSILVFEIEVVKAKSVN